MQLHVHPGQNLPIYRQIVHQVLDELASGRLVAGSRLPAKNELAERLVISPRTVEKAYGELASRGLVEDETVCAVTPATNGNREELRVAARRLITEARTVGVPLAAVQDLVREAFDELLAERERHDVEGDAS